ncbi:MAG TPA: sensor histidine kinase [Lysobacter sp.]|nr:sensor histidine kinase [Lysobacter sp.]
MTRRLVTLILVLAAFVVFAPAARAHLPHEAAAPVDLSADAVYLHDPRGDFDIATVRRLARADFARPGAMHGLGVHGGATWVRLDVPAHVSRGEWWLSVGPATIGSVTLYATDASGRATMRELGTATPFAHRPVHFRMPVFPLAIGDVPQSRSLYLRVSGQNTGHVEPLLWRPASFAGMVEREYALWGAYFGILALLIAFTLFFWLELRSTAYLRYSLYLASFFAMLWLLEGFGAQWLLPDSPEAATYLTRAIAFVAMGYTLWFGTELLEVRRRFPRLQRIATALSLLQAGGAVAVLFVSEGVVLRAALAIALAWQPVFFVLLGHQWRHRPDLRPVIVAFAPQMLGLVLMVLRQVGMAPPGFWWTHAPELAGSVHMVVLSLALMRRMRDAERRALALSRESGERLDRKVAERTSALADANRRLMSEIAERRMAQAELAGALKSERGMLEAQRDFVAMVSHEFRTPLAVIKTVAQRLGSHPSLQDDDLQHRLGRVDRATARMTAMIQTYLADDRMRTPERARQTTRFTAADLAAAAAEHHGDMHARVRLDVPRDLPGIEGDFALLTVALANLIDNGLKYSTAPAPVVVHADAIGSDVRFRVADRGGGVGESERVRIFQRYVRGSASSGRGGAGLGLHLAQAIARLHGGDIAIERTGDDGSVFAMTVPQAVADAVPASGTAVMDH